jgi:hypothetical protein
LAIGRILGNWEGFLVNWKIQNPNPIGIGLWKIDGFEKVGRRTIPPPTCNKIHHESSSVGTTTRTPYSKSSRPKPQQLFLLVKTNTLTYYLWSLTP